MLININILYYSVLCHVVLFQRGFCVCSCYVPADREEKGKDSVNTWVRIKNKFTHTRVSSRGMGLRQSSGLKYIFIYVHVYI